MAFDPKNLAPAANIAALSKAQAGRTMKAVALDNIDKQVALLADKAMEGKRTFRVVGDNSAFSVRVGNQALELEVFVDGKPAKTKEVAVPTKDLKDAFTYYRKEIEAGKYDAALAALDTGRAARVEKMRATRAAKPKADKKAG
jgi:hypothetical protein